MKLVRLFPLAALALILLAIVSFCVATVQVTFLIVTGTIAAVSWYVCEGPRGFAVPKWLSNILIIAASLAIVPDLLAHRYEVLHVLGRYTVIIILIKLYERKNRRDYAQLLWLSLLLVVAGILESRSLLLGVALLLYSGLGIPVLLLYQLWGGYEASEEYRQAQAPPEAAWVPAPRPVLGRTVHGQFAWTAGGVAVVGVFASAIIFASYPRQIGHGMVHRFVQPIRVNKTTLVDEVALRTGSRITESKTPVFEVRLLSPAGEPIEYGSPLHLRGAALDEYNTQTFTWRDSGSSSRFLATVQAGPDGFTSLARFEDGGAGDPIRDESRMGTPSDALANAYTLEFAPLATMGQTVFALASPLAISTEAPQRIVFDNRTHAIALASSNRLNTYHVMCDPLASEHVVEALNGGVVARLGGQRYNDPRVRAEALRILAKAGLPAEVPSHYPQRGEHDRRAARAFEQYLIDNFRYTLNLSEVEIEGDPIVGFLFDFKKGHCEYFASAMTAMCQAVGIDARLVTGFLAAEYEGDGYYRVRESNAHAWVEVRTSLYGWSTFDPTPPAAVEQYHMPGNALADRVRGIYEFFEAGWIQGIVGFDDASQAQLQQTLSMDSFAWLDDAVQGAAAWLSRFVARFGIAGTLQILVVAAACVVALLIVIQLVRRARRIRKTLHLEHLKGAEYRRMLRQLGFYIDMLDLLRRGGLHKPAWQPPLAYANAIAGARPDVVNPVRALTDTFYAARYGGRELTHDDSEHTRTALDQLAAVLGVKR